MRQMNGRRERRIVPGGVALEVLITVIRCLDGSYKQSSF